MALFAKDAWRTVGKTVLVVGTLATLYLLFLLRRLLLTLFLAVILASALRPLVNWLQERLRLPRTLAVLALYALVALTVVAGVAAAAPSLTITSMALLRSSASIYGRWYDLALSLREGVLTRLSIALPMPPPQDAVTAWVAQVGDAFGRMLPEYVTRTGGALGDLALGLLMACYWLEARDDLLGAAARELPRSWQLRFQAVFDDIEHALGAYLAGQLILSLLIGVSCLVAFLALRLPYAGALAFISGLLHVVPLVGATAAAVLPILVAVSLSPGKGLATAVVVLLIHQVENAFVAPRILQRQVGLSPLTVIVAFTAGAALYGVLGALIAIPVVGTLSILIRHLLIEPIAEVWRARPEAAAEARAQEAQVEGGSQEGSTGIG